MDLTEIQRQGFRDMAAAIRRGIERYPHQCKGNLFVRLVDGSVGCCALGAAWAGAHSDATDRDLFDWAAELDTFSAITALFNLVRLSVPYPGELSDLVYEYNSLEATIYRLNDTEEWGREKIAAWLDSLAESAA